MRAYGTRSVLPSNQAVRAEQGYTGLARVMVEVRVRVMMKVRVKVRFKVQKDSGFDP